MKLERSELFDQLYKECVDTPEYAACGLRIELAEMMFNKLDGRPYTWLASKMGVSRSRVSKIMRGEENITLLTLCKICKALNMKLEFREVNK